MTVFCEGIRRNDGHHARAKKVNDLGRWYNTTALCAMTSQTGLHNLQQALGHRIPGKRLGAGCLEPDETLTQVIRRHRRDLGDVERHLLHPVQAANEQIVVWDM